MNRAESASCEPPVLASESVHLRPVHPDDLSYLYYGLFTAPENLFRSRLHGDTPLPEEFMRRISEHAAAQFVLVHRESEAPFGHVALYGVNLRDGFAHVEITTGRETMGAPGTHEGASLFLDYVFRLWPVRKVYAHLSEFNAPLLEGQLGSVFEEEGVLREHEFYAGRYWDIHVFALYRESWEGNRLRGHGIETESEEQRVDK